MFAGPRTPTLRHRSFLVMLSATLLLAACAAPGTQAPPAPPTAEPAIVVESTVMPTLAAEPTAPAAPTAEPTTAPTLAATSAPTAEPTAEPSPTAAPTAVALAPFDAALATELQSILDQLVADGYIPGAVLAVTMPGQEPWVGSAGVADRAQGLAMTADTRVRIASISKVFTGVLILQLAEDGLLDLDAPMSTYLPNLLANGDQITVRQLLQHTTGLYDYLEDRSFGALPYANPNRTFAPSELVEYASRLPASFAPGAADAWDYSSTNFVILGMIAEQVTGNTLAQEMRTRIFEPLELSGTYFAPDEAVDGQLSKGHIGGNPLTDTSMSFAFGTANIISTADDVRRFVEAIFAGDLLAPDTLVQMTSVVGGQGQYNMPELAYGLGIMQNRLPVEAQGDDALVYGHIGGFGGFRSAVWHAPASGITVSLGVNQASTDPNILATQAFRAALNALER